MTRVSVPGLIPTNTAVVASDGMWSGVPGWLLLLYSDPFEERLALHEPLP
jgi:hypothetical protein